MIARFWRPLRIALLSLTLLAGPAIAVEPSEVLSDPALEARARALSTGLRCLVCRNQSIDDSNAELARDLRIVLRERMVAGDSDDEALDYLVDRYGNYILLKPPFNISTLLLWIGPGLFLLAALLGFRAMWRDQRKSLDEGEELTDADRQLIAQALSTKDAQ